MADWDVIIIGAGLTGLSVGALLTDAGKKVLILEKNSRMGGRMIGTTRDGHALDDAGHGPSTAGHLEEIWERLGLTYPEGAGWGVSEIYRDGQWREMVSQVNRDELRKVFQEIGETPIEELERVYDMPLKDWVSLRTQDQGVHDWFQLIAVATFAGHASENISAGATLVLLKEIVTKTGGFGRGGSYKILPGGCCAQLIGALEGAVKERNIEVRLNTTVRNTVIESGRVRGVEVDVEPRLTANQFLRTELIKAPIVVSTLPLWDVFKVVPTDDLPYWYVEWVEKVQYKVGTWWAIHYALDGHIKGWEDEELLKVILPQDHPRGMFLMSAYWPGYAPEGQSQWSHWLSADRNLVPNLFHMNQARVWKQMKEMFDLFEQDLKMFFPDMVNRVLWKTQHIGAYTIVEEPGTSVLGRPYMQPPEVEGLYLASDTVRQGRGTGMQAAAHAALQCVERILG